MADASRIDGNPGAHEAAAIIAAVDYLLAEEATARTVPERVLPSDWVLATRPRPFHAPLPAEVYDAMGGWGTVGEADEHHRP
jgi:hypothetical protein